MWLIARLLVWFATIATAVADRIHPPPQDDFAMWETEQSNIIPLASYRDKQR